MIPSVILPLVAISSLLGLFGLTADIFFLFIIRQWCTYLWDLPPNTDWESIYYLYYFYLDYHEEHSKLFLGYWLLLFPSLSTRSHTASVMLLLHKLRSVWNHCQSERFIAWWIKTCVHNSINLEKIPNVTGWYAAPNHSTAFTVCYRWLQTLHVASLLTSSVHTDADSEQNISNLYSSLHKTEMLFSPVPV